MRFPDQLNSALCKIGITSTNSLPCRDNGRSIHHTPSVSKFSDIPLGYVRKVLHYARDLSNEYCSKQICVNHSVRQSNQMLFYISLSINEYIPISSKKCIRCYLHCVHLRVTELFFPSRASDSSSSTIPIRGDNGMFIAPIGLQNQRSGVTVASRDVTGNGR